MSVTVRILVTVIGSGIVVAILVTAFRDWNAASAPETAALPDAHKPAPIVSAQFVEPLPRDDSYVGSQACAECHRELYDSYQQHPMAQSLSAVHTARAIEDYEGDQQFSSSRLARYEIRKDGDKVEHAEVRLDRSGKEIVRQTVPVHYALGSGKRGRAYLTDNDGLLFMSPITWYSGTSQWDLSPGYSGTEHRRFSRRIVDGCLQCHAGRVDDDLSGLDRFKEPPFLEESIGCERCHGPAESHVAFHRDESPVDSEDPILKLASLDWPQRESLCMQCHLPGVERVPHFGRSDFDFRPGDHVNDIWTIFVEGSELKGHQNFEAVSHVEQMMVSRCFLNSEGKFGCTICHDPHSSPDSSEVTAHYVGKCLQCHEQPDTDCALSPAERTHQELGSSCISCHMPKRDASDIPHTAQTDHRIQRRPSTRKKNSITTPLVKVFSLGAHSADPLEVMRTQFLFDARRLGDNASPDEISNLLATLTEIRPLFEKDPIAIVAIARLFRISGDFKAAQFALTRALEFQPEYETALEEQALLFDRTGDSANASDAFEKFFEVNPWRSDMYGRHAHLLGRMQQVEKAIEAAERSLEINPTAWFTHQWLANVYQLKGDEELSRKHSELRDSLMPPRR